MSANFVSFQYQHEPENYAVRRDYRLEGPMNDGRIEGVCVADNGMRLLVPVPIFEQMCRDWLATHGGHISAAPVSNIPVKEVRRAVRKCSFCGYRADMMCMDCGLFFCWQDVMATRTAWAIACDKSSEGHAFVPIIQKDSEGTVKSTNPEQGRKEGKKLAFLLGKVFVKQENQDFNAITQLANYLSIEVLSYRDAEISNGFTRGFVAEMIGSAEDATEDYIAGNITADQLAKAVATAFALQRQQEKQEEKLKQLEDAEAKRQRQDSAPTVDED